MKRVDVDRAQLPDDADREMLRDSVRGWLASRKPDSTPTDLWNGWAGLGLAGLGSRPEEGGLREIAVVMEELGRADCAAPMLAAALSHLGLAASEQPQAHALLAGIASGDVWPALWIDAGLERDCGSLRLQDRRAHGILRAVEGSAAATHLLLLAADGLHVVDCAEPALTLHEARALGSAGWCEARLEGAACIDLRLDAANAEDLFAVARVCHLARAHGAARRAFELAVDWAKQRHQFGQPIGRFQAIQHKLANSLIALEGVRLTVQHAATAFDFGDADWLYFAHAAHAFGAHELRRVALETQHTLGAVGYAQEHEAPRHFRSVHRDAIRLGGAAASRRVLAEHHLDARRALPTYDLGEAGNSFRRDVRRWLAAHWSGERKRAFEVRPYHDREFDAGFARDLGATGWLGLSWPKRFGGQQRSAREQLAFLECMEDAEAPPRFGASVQAHAIMMHGTPDQQTRYLPEILRGDAMHGMGYSEPQAGSDLAALRTTATRVNDERGDGWLINGQKIWTTTWWGQYMFLAARTDRDARPAHAGISMFMVPMDAPGITIEPAATMYDGSFANIFYDDVYVPADAMVGPMNGGWKVLTDALATERGLVGGGIVLKVAHAFDLLCDDVRDDPALRTDPVLRDRIGLLAAEIEVGRQLMLHCAELAESGLTPPEAGAISKVFSGELMERFGEAALDILGPRAALSQEAPGSVRNGRYEQNLRHSLMWVISIGTNEIQRSLIAQRALGLPR